MLDRISENPKLTATQLLFATEQFLKN